MFDFLFKKQEETKPSIDINEIYAKLKRVYDTEEISNDMTATQIMQMGQEAYSNGNYKKAEYYYNTALTRFGMDTVVYVQVRYELGHIYVKTKEYEKAKLNFNEVLDVYASTPAGMLPPSYKTLAQKGLASIPESTK